MFLSFIVISFCNYNVKINNKTSFTKRRQGKEPGKDEHILIPATPVFNSLCQIRYTGKTHIEYGELKQHQHTYIQDMFGLEHIRPEKFEKYKSESLLYAGQIDSGLVCRLMRSLKSIVGLTRE